MLCKYRLHLDLIDPRPNAKVYLRRHTFIGETEDYVTDLAVTFTKAIQAVDPRIQANFSLEENLWLVKDFTEESLNKMLNDV